MTIFRLLYVSINVLHPGESKKKKKKKRERERKSKHTHAPSPHSWIQLCCFGGLCRTLLHLDREPVLDAALCVRAHTVCPEYHCWVLVHVCVRAVGVGGLVRKLRRPPLWTFGLCLMYRSELWAQKRWISVRDKRRRWRAPFLWLLLYIPIFWMCKPVHVVWKFLY